MALVLAASPPNLPESTFHDRRSGPRRHRPLLAEDLPWPRSVCARADGGDQRRPPPRLRNARLCRSADPRPARRPPVIRRSATAAVPRGAAKRQIPIARPRRRTITVPRFPPLEAFGRRPSGPHLRPRQGRHPKPYKEAVIHFLLCQCILSDPLPAFQGGPGPARQRRSIPFTRFQHLAKSTHRAGASSVSIRHGNDVRDRRRDLQGARRRQPPRRPAPCRRHNKPLHFGRPEFDGLAVLQTVSIPNATGRGA